MEVELFTSVLCGLFSLGFGVWLFDYVRKRDRSVKTQTGTYKPSAKFYLLSVTFIFIGLILIFVTITSLGSNN